MILRGNHHDHPCFASLKGASLFNPGVLIVLLMGKRCALNPVDFMEDGSRMISLLLLREIPELSFGKNLKNPSSGRNKSIHLAEHTQVIFT